MNKMSNIMPLYHQRRFTTEFQVGYERYFI